MYKRFEELKAWQEARKYRQDIYELSKKFHKKELYGLTSQICRAVSSITANIAEGYGRYHWQENIQACRISRGSLNEVLDHLYTALDCKYITQEEFNKYYNNGRNLEQLLNGYIRYLEKCKS
ncbi:MAG: four helix bundle protein [Elusimicrobia bacterium]|nr:four helix bundle protein [Elusimicrobiota bacterium]